MVVYDWFINDEVKTLRLPDLIDTAWKLRETQGDNTRAAADAALRDGGYDALDDFVNGGGYDKARYSDQLQQAYHLVKVVARRSKPPLKPPLPGTGRPSTSSSPSSSIAAACSTANAMPTTPKLIPSSNWETKPPMTPRNKPRPHRRPTSRQTEQPTGPMNTPAKHGNTSIFQISSPVPIYSDYVYEPNGNSPSLHDYCTSPSPQFWFDRNTMIAADLRGPCSYHDLCYERNPNDFATRSNLCDPALRRDWQYVCQASYDASITRCRGFVDSTYTVMHTYQRIKN